MTTQTEALSVEETLKLALKNAEAIVSSNLPQYCPDCEATMVWVHSMAQSIVQSIKEALAQPEQEPVAHSVVEPLRHDEYQRRVSVKWVNQPVAGPLYTTPPTQCNCSQRQCNAVSMKHIKPLTEAAHGIKENT